MIWRFCDRDPSFLGVTGVNGVASVIGVAAKPATSRKAKEYAGYARYARRQISRSNAIGRPIPSETHGFVRLLGRQRIARSKRGTGPDLAAESLPTTPPISEQAH